MTNLTTLRRQLMLCCYRYATSTTPVQKFYRAGEREALVAAIKKAKA